MQTVSLSFQVPDYGECVPVSPEPARKMKEVYPSFCIPGNASLAKSLKAGQEFEAVVKFRVKGVTIEERDGDRGGYPSEYSGTRVELEAKEMVMKGMPMQADDDEQTGKDAIRNYFTKKTSLAGEQDEDVA